jgi:uncharacterized delta-60 repeat protein
MKTTIGQNRTIHSITCLVLLGVNTITTHGQQPGDLDSSFDPGTGVPARANSLNALVIQEDGKVIVGGGFTNYNGAAVGSIVRLNSDGSLDTNYLGAGEFIGAMQRDADGRMLVAGTLTEFDGAPRDRIARLNADGSIDPGFVPQAGFNGFYPEIFAVAVQSDGKVIVGGTFGLASTTNLNIARLEADGRLDETFHANRYGSVLALAVQPDGKILLGGTFGLSRLSPDGSPDSNFGPVSVSIPGPDFPTITVKAIHLFEDGRILIGGKFSRVNGETRNNLALLTADGKLDEAFENGVGADEEIRTILVEADGQIVVGGLFEHYDNFPRLHIARLLRTGWLDLGFRCALETAGLAGNIPSSFGPNALALQSDGRILVVGIFSTVNGTDRQGIARIFAGESPEETPRILTSPLEFTVSEGTNLTLNADFTGTPFPRVEWRLNGSTLVGATNNTLRLHNILGKDAGEYTLALSNTLGTVTGVVATLTVLPAPNTPGAADVGFDPGEALENPSSSSLPGQPLRSWVQSLALQPDGRLLAGGRFTSYNGLPAGNLVRLNPDGSLDGEFNRILTASNLVPFAVDDILLQPEGAIIVAGRSTKPGVVRLNADGTRDASFQVSLGPIALTYSTTPFRLACQSDSKIILSGGFLELNGEISTYLARLNADGTRDSSFKADLGFSALQILGLVVQDDDRLVIGGNFTNVNGVARNSVARLNADGSLDDSFSPGPGPQDGFVSTVLVQPDSRILVGGNFTAFAGAPRRFITRLLPDGSLDPTFDPGTNVHPQLKAVALQPDGKILVAGGWYPGSAAQGGGIVRLQRDGSLDSDFSAPANDAVYDVVPLRDGRIAVGGAFSRFDNVLRSGIAVLHGDPSLFDCRAGPGGFSATVKTTFGRSYILEYRDSFMEGSWTALPGVVGGGSPATLTVTGPMAKQRFYRLRVEAAGQ